MLRSKATKKLLAWLEDLKILHKVQPGDILVIQSDNPSCMSGRARRIFNRAVDQAGLEGIAMLVLPKDAEFHRLNKERARKELEKLIERIEEEGGQDAEGQGKEDDTGR